MFEIVKTIFIGGAIVGISILIIIIRESFRDVEIDEPDEDMQP